MAEHSRFFDSLNPLDPDKVYTAAEFVGYVGKLITDGILKGEANMLKVETSGSNMNTTVDTGTAFLKAREYDNDSKLSLTHEVEALGKSRIDRVVIRLMLHVDYRYIKAFVKKGVAGTAPIAPPLERTDEVYEISLAQVTVIGGQTYINVADIVDERGTPVICPWAGSKILPNFDDSALEDLVDKVDNMYTPVEANSTDGVTYSVVLDGVTTYDESMVFVVKPNMTNTNYAKLSVNGLPAINLTYIGEALVMAGLFTQRGLFTVRYNGLSFVMEGTALNDSLTSNAKNTAATANAVRQLNDKILAIEKLLNV